MADNSKRVEYNHAKKRFLEIESIRRRMGTDKMLRVRHLCGYYRDYKGITTFPSYLSVREYQKLLKEYGMTHEKVMRLRNQKHSQSARR